MEKILVRTAPDGAPRSFTRGGHDWRVAVEPVRWFERTRWWEERIRLPRGGGGRVDVEVWRVQAMPGRRGLGLRTFELVRDETDGWSVRDQIS